jgi:diacylglycerol kinase family enzyme
MLETARIVIYFNSLHRHAAYYAEAYKHYFLRQSPLPEVILIASTPSREHDLAQLRQRLYALDEVVVIGGDGSINLVAQVIALQPLRLTIIPCGTGNDFARDLGLSDWRWRMQAELQIEQVTIGKAGKEYFINHAGSGLSADLISLQPRWLKQMFGRLSYSIAIVRYVFGPLSRRQQIYRRGAWYDCHIAAVSRFIGGGIPVNPYGSRQHHELQWLALPRSTRWRQLVILLQVLRQRSEQCSELEQQRSGNGKLGSADAHYELDGDLRGLGPIQIECIPAGLTVLRPKASNPVNH